MEPELLRLRDLIEAVLSRSREADPEASRALRSIEQALRTDKPLSAEKTDALREVLEEYYRELDQFAASKGTGAGFSSERLNRLHETLLDILPGDPDTEPY